MILHEATRNELINKNKLEDPEKYARRMNYIASIKPLPIAKDIFMETGTLTVPIKIGDYVVTVHISGIIKQISDDLKASGKKLPDRPMVYKALRKVVDTSNLYVNCTCADFRYRHAYWASKDDYKYGSPERRPADIRNPDNKGATCKHITTAIVRPSQWLKYAAGWASTIVRQVIQQQLELQYKNRTYEYEDVPEEETDEFVPNEEELKEPEQIEYTDITEEPEES